MGIGMQALRQNPKFIFGYQNRDLVDAIGNLIQNRDNLDKLDLERIEKNIEANGLKIDNFVLHGSVTPLFEISSELQLLAFLLFGGVEHKPSLTFTLHPSEELVLVNWPPEQDYDIMTLLQQTNERLELDKLHRAIKLNNDDWIESSINEKTRIATTLIKGLSLFKYRAAIIFPDALQNPRLIVRIN